ncbi:MAG: HD domain-containing protein, partial [Anaerococcus obesiensis]
MFDFSKYKDKLKNDIGEKRFNHVIRVKDMALKINKNIDIEKIKTAALLHDCAKYNEKYYLDKYK